MLLVMTKTFKFLSKFFAGNYSIFEDLSRFFVEIFLFDYCVDYL